MDKDKNRTDLLAAGRKKLQQFRQKKDGKGSKSSGKASRSDPDVVTNEASSVAKPAKGKTQLQVAEGSIQSLNAELPNCTTILPIEVSGDGEDGSSLVIVNDNDGDAMVPDEEDIQSSNTDSGLTRVSSSETVDVEGKPESGQKHVLPIGLKAVLDYANASGEPKSAHGEDQEEVNSGLESDNRSNLMDREGDVNPALSGYGERAPLKSGGVQEETKMECSRSVTEQTSECPSIPAFVDVSDYPDATKAYVHSVSPLSLPISDGFTALTCEPTIQPEDDVVAGFHGKEVPKLAPASSDSECGSLESRMISGGQVTPVSLTQLSKVLQLLDEDEFRFLVMKRESVTSGHSRTDAGFGVLTSGSSELCERVKEQVYITNLEKEMNYMHLREQWDAQREANRLSNELVQCRSELDEVSCEREELQKHMSSPKSELNGCSARIDELQIELERSEYQLSNAKAELVDCRDSLADLQIKNEDVNMHVASLTKEKNELEKDKVDCSLQNEKLVKELMECNDLLELSRAENVSLMDERARVKEEKQHYVRENDKLLSELAEWRRLVKALQVDNANLNGILASEREDRSQPVEAKEYVEENEKLSTELLECQVMVEILRSGIANLNGSLDLERSRLREEIDNLKFEKEEHVTELTNYRTSMKGLQARYEKAMGDLKDGSERLERLTAENTILTSTLDIYKAKMREVEDLKMKSEQSTSQESILAEDSSQKVLEKGGRETSHPTLKDDQLEWDAFEESLGFVALKRRLSEVEDVTQKLDKEIEAMHSDSAFLTRPGGKAVAPGVSKLIQAFELKGPIDEELEEMPLREDSDLHLPAKEQMDNLKHLFKDLVLDAENASELFKVERSGKTLSETKLRELMVHVGTLREQSSNLEETFIEHVVLDEVVKQYVCTVEAKKGQLLVLYEDLRQDEIITKAKNCELTEKLCKFESRISQMQMQVNELQHQSDNMASLTNQLKTCHRKLDDSIGTMSSTPSSETSDSQNIGTRAATSVDAAIAVIQDLQGKLEDAHRNHHLLSVSYEGMTVKTKDLEEKNALAADVLHKVYDNLRELVKDSHSSIEESRDDISSKKLLDPLNINNYEILIEQLRKLIGERGLFESMNREHISELLEKKKDMEELNRRCINSDLIVKLLGDIESVVKLEDIEIKPDEPVSSLDSIIHLLIEGYRSAEEQVRLLREKLKTKEMILFEFQGQIDLLRFSIVAYENESNIFKESLRCAMEQLITFQSEIQLKETELQQSEQRVSALREKLHIAVTKGKGLISQRDNLKQSLTATSSELEKCLHELQLKDATLQETETKLKTYSEAGERMEALESELSYIRNSATALRESFLLKDSVLQRIEEILEDLELPEHLYARGIIEKIDWLARSVSGNSFPVSSWDQKSSTGAGSYSDSGFGAMDGWKEDLQPASVPGDELRRNYEELQSKYYGLAEQNEMLEQSLMERNNLLQRWEEILDKINMPSQLRSLEPEDKIEWLSGALSEANGRCETLQQNISDLENVCGSRTADLEDSQRRLSDLEQALQLITNKREHVSASLAVLRNDYRIVSEKATFFEIENDRLQNEVGTLQLNLDENRVDEEHIHHVHGEIRRLQDIVREALQDPESEDLDSSTSDIQCLEGLLRKLADMSIKHPPGQHLVGDKVENITEEIRTMQSGNHEELDLAVLERKLEEVEGDLMHMKEERDRYVEKNQSLVHKVEALEAKNQELQKLLVQEEQKSASVKEKLNVAVRKGKSLVQQRDSMKQCINDLTSEVEHLKSEIKLHKNTLLECEQKMKGLLTSQERMEEIESEAQLLKNRLAEVDGELQDKRNTLGMMLGVVAVIDVGVELRTNDPVEKLNQIEKICHDLHAEISVLEQDSRKSKRAAELLFAELNQVQERNEDLEEELSKATKEFSELSKDRDLAEAAKHEYLSHFEQLSALHSEERSSQVLELTVLHSGLDQLRSSFIRVSDLLNDVLPKDIDFLYNLEASIKSLLVSSNISSVGGQTIAGAPIGIVSRSEDKVNDLHSESFLGCKREQNFDDKRIIDLWRSVESHLQDLISRIGVFEAKLQSQSKTLHEMVILLSETVKTLHIEMTSHKSSLDSAKEDIAQLQSAGKQIETENLMLHRYISMLYEACRSSVLEIEKCKDQLTTTDSTSEDMRYQLTSVSIGGDIFSGQTLSISEECVTSMVNRLLSLVKDFHNIQANCVEVSQKEMKATISSLQRELREKDTEKDRICVELVNQIKQAEAVAMSRLKELEPAKAHINDLQGQLEAVNKRYGVFEQRAKKLQDQEAILVNLQERVKSLTEALTAKEQEAEALLQALDEEEGQMEELTNKITELERLVQLKDLDLESAEASCGKTLKKLSITVSKFDELHHLSETILSEVERLQSQVQERDSEISFLRDEITRCTSDSLLTLKDDDRGLDEIQDIMIWLDTIISGVQKQNLLFDDKKIYQVHEYKEILQKQITSIFLELEDLREVARSKDDLLHVEWKRVEDLRCRGELLENSLREKESQLSMHQNIGDSAQASTMTSDIVEVEPMIKKWPVQGTSIAPQVRSSRKVNSDQLAVSIDDRDSDDRDRLEDEDDDKAHGFKSLTTSKIVPRFTRPVTDLIDGLWVSCDRALMRQPALRLGVIIYWAVMHALLATFVV